VLLVAGAHWPGHGEPIQALRLFRNNGVQGAISSTFTETTQASGLGEVSAFGLGITMADYDNDGDLDIFLTTLYENMLFRNDGGRFTEVGQSAGLSAFAEWSSAALFFDADRDGWIDLFVGNYIDWSLDDDIRCTVTGKEKSYCTPEIYKGVPGRFYKNNGSSELATGTTFTEQTLEAGFAEAPGKTLAVAELDFNRDGWPDVFVANDTQRDLLYENQGDGTFVEKGIVSGIAFDENGEARAGMGVDTGDVENQGQVSIFVAHFSKEMIGVYRHTGNGLFMDRAAVSKIGRPSLLRLTFGLFLFDAELDGDLDLFAANGHLNPEIEMMEDGILYRQQAQLFLNKGNGTFAPYTPSVDDAFQAALIARGAAYADIDRDGDLDVLVTENAGPVRLWRNETNTGSFLRVRLEGQQSNRDGLGASLIAVVGEERMERRIHTGSSYLSQSETIATFGLGAATQVDSLLVSWPSGHVDRIIEVHAGQQIRVVEGQNTFKTDYP
jgi:hypothetical protein